MNTDKVCQHMDMAGNGWLWVKGVCSGCKYECQHEEFDQDNMVCLDCGEYDESHLDQEDAMIDQERDRRAGL